MKNKTLELRTFRGCTECVEIDGSNSFKPVVIFTVDEQSARAFVLTQVSKDGNDAIYQEAEHLSIGN